jgi:hypothetical protein
MSLPMFLFLIAGLIVSCSGRRPSMLCRSEADGREWALAPPDYLPSNFFNTDGSRVWAKLASGIHQCELCGYEAKTKNKYREKQVQHYSIKKDDIHIKLRCFEFLPVEVSSIDGTSQVVQ